MRFTTNLYCDILGYDAVQFDVYILTFPRKIFPQNYGQNMEVKCSSARSYTTKAMNSKIYGEQLQKEKLSAVLWSRRRLTYYTELTKNPAEYYHTIYKIFVMKIEILTTLLEICCQILCMGMKLLCIQAADKYNSAYHRYINFSYYRE
jgi:hypothetical protein